MSGGPGQGCSGSDEELHRIRNGSSTPVRNGTHARPGSPAPRGDSGKERASSAACSRDAVAGGSVASAAAQGPLSEPDRLTGWVRQALQQSWGAWLAGDESAAAWDACRRGATGADAAFIDDMRRMSWQGEGLGAQHGMSASASPASAEAAAASQLDALRSDSLLSPTHTRPWLDSRDGVVTRDSDGWASMHADDVDAPDLDASPWFEREYDGPQQVGAVIDDAEEDDEQPYEDDSVLEHLTSILPPDRAMQRHGPELCSYIYGHVRFCLRCCP